MSDATRRMKRWQKKYGPAQAKATLDLLHDDAMQQRYEAATIAMTAMELKTKEVLNAHGVHTTNYVPYLSYARQLRKLTRQNISGERFKMASEVLLQKWAARGCDPKVLAKIRTDVFDISATKS
jgi:hypothetical protein